MKTSSLLLVLTILASCAQVTEKKITMELPFAPELVRQIQQQITRAPASLEVSDIEGKSPRRVYFSALYHQYLTLGQHLGRRPDLNSCPQFHHDRLETEAGFLPAFSPLKQAVVDDEGRNFFPETVFGKDLSLLDYYSSISQEISVLCEEGLSDNYYKFDNLITHYAGKKDFHRRPEAMRAVLKIPVFANYYLLKMLQAPHTLAFIHPEEKRVISMTQTQWFKRYVDEAHRQRGNLIKNQMVKASLR
jgi:hypothetical protein